MGLPLFTSLPPQLRRTESDASAAFLSYQEHCIRSWVQADFDVYSVNAASEATPEQLTGLVTFVRVERDASAIASRKLPYVADILQVAASHAREAGCFAITNADIFFANPSDVVEKLAVLEPDECIVESRYDVENRSGILEAQPYAYGFDFFGFNARSVERLGVHPFVFGLPWWDHALPMSAMMSGFRRMRIKAPFAYHLRHEERWDWSLWRQLGADFVTALTKYSSGSAASAGEHRGLLLEYASILSEVNRRFQTLGSEDTEFRTGLLHHISDLNLKLLRNW